MTEQAQFPDLPPQEPSQEQQPLVVKLKMARANRQQVEMRAVTLDDLLAVDHPARMVWSFAQGCDLHEFEGEVRSYEGECGRPATDPTILFALWLFGMSQGIGSAREITRLTKEHDAYRWLCGGVSINYHTLSDFRSQGEKLDSLFTASLAVLTKEGLLSIDRIALDGMRVRASAGASSFRKRETLEGWLEDAEEQVAKLKEAPAKESLSASEKKARERAAEETLARVRQALAQMPAAEAAMERRRGKSPADARTSTTDPEARNMKMADNGFRPAYNDQVAVDTQGRLIAGVGVTNIGSDMAQLSPMLDQLEQRFGRLPNEVLVDGGYPSQGAIDDAYARGVKVFAPVQKPKDPARNKFLPLPGDSDARAEWRVRMGTDEAKELYKERGSTVEWVNACLRRYGLRALLVRGLKKVRAVLLLAAFTHNLFRAAALRKERAPAAA